MIAYDPSVDLVIVKPLYHLQGISVMFERNVFMAAHWERIIPNVTNRCNVITLFSSIRGHTKVKLANGESDFDFVTVLTLASALYVMWGWIYFLAITSSRSFKKGQQHVPWPCNRCRFGIADCQFRVSFKTHHSHHYLSASTISLLKVWHLLVAAVKS